MNTYKKTLVDLKVRIKKLAAEGRRLRHVEAKKVSGNARYYLQCEADGLGHEARHALLAYGLLRGRAYKDIEAKTREDNEPSSTYIFDFTPEGLLPDGTVTAWLKGEFRAERPVREALAA